MIQQARDGMVEIIYANSFPRPTITEALDIVRQLIQKHHIVKVYCDAAAPGFIGDLMLGYGQDGHSTMIRYITNLNIFSRR